MPQIKHVEDHPIEDFYGLELHLGDLYWVFGNVIVSDLNLRMYLLEIQQVPCYRAM